MNHSCEWAVCRNYSFKLIPNSAPFLHARTTAFESHLLLQFVYITRFSPYITLHSELTSSLLKLFPTCIHSDSILHSFSFILYFSVALCAGTLCFTGVPTPAAVRIVSERPEKQVLFAESERGKCESISSHIQQHILAHFISWFEGRIVIYNLQIGISGEPFSLHYTQLPYLIHTQGVTLPSV